MLWLLWLTGDTECPEINRQVCDSYSGSYDSLETLKTFKDIDLPLVHTVAPKVHWGPRTHQMARPVWRWCVVAPGAHWGPRMALPTCHLYVIHIVAPVPHWGPRTLKMTRCTWHWYSVAPGLTGDTECPEMARSTYGSSSGTYGSSGTLTAWEWLDVHDGDI